VELSIQQPRPEASRSSFKVTGAFALDQVKAIVEWGQRLPQQAKLTHAMKSFQAESRSRAPKLHRNRLDARNSAPAMRRDIQYRRQANRVAFIGTAPVATAPGAAPQYVPMLSVQI
jgi:hypothetical protein